MSKAFAGKVVVVTGANSGIGETAVAQFVEAGATVFGVARRKDALEAARSRHPTARWVLGDVSQEASIKPAIESVIREVGGVDVLVNNAATFSIAPLAQSNEKMIREQYDANVLGTIFATQAALASLTERRGTVINISSAAGHKPVPGASIYGSTKAAVESLTRSWALELAPVGVRVNAIAPGPTETAVLDKLGFPPDQTAAVKASFLSQVPLARMASTDEVCRWIIQLASPQVTWVTGQIISIDGGMSLT